MKKLNTADILKNAAKAGLNAGGGFAAVKINSLPLGKDKAGAARTLGSLNGFLRSGIKIAFGIFAPTLIKDTKMKAHIEDAAAGWNAVAGLELANAIITKGGKENVDKMISIGAIGDIDPNVMGTADMDASYILDENLTDQGVNGIKNVY